jgi:diguanylate cyclase (GGDEF)-like protein
LCNSGYNHQVHARLESSSNHDELTGLLNRRGFLKLAQKESQRSKRYGNSLTLLSMDIDHFKSINDEFGHDVGDLVLSRFARLVSQNLRKNDLLCRWGGEEFLLLIPETSTRKTSIVAEKVRQSISNKPFNMGDAQLRLTVSIGCATVLPADRDVFLAIKA